MEVEAWALVAPGRRVQVGSISTAPDVVRVKRRDMSIMIFLCARGLYLGTGTGRRCVRPPGGCAAAVVRASRADWAHLGHTPGVS